MLQIIKKPNSKVVCKCVRFTRIICDHATFAGATVDLYCVFHGITAFPLVFFPHAAFFTAAVSVYLMHIEERFERNGVGYGPLIQ